MPQMKKLAVRLKHNDFFWRACLEVGHGIRQNQKTNLEVCRRFAKNIIKASYSLNYFMIFITLLDNTPIAHLVDAVIK